MTLSSPLNTQQLELESITTLESQLQQRQSLAAIGQRYTDIVWAAGLFEGEGYICPDKRRNCYWTLGIEMTDKDVLDRYANVIGSDLLRPRKTIQKTQHKQSWIVVTTKRSEVLRILKMFLPHFGKRRAEKAIEAINHLNEIIN